jgi:hypothetical protein
MRNAEDILSSLNDDRLKIIETGCVATRSITRWVSNHSESEFVNVDLDFPLQLATHKELECDGIARHCTFLNQDHGKYLSTRTWADVIFLNPPDLQSGVMEFLLAVSTGARLIVMNDYQARSALAIKRAREIGWEYESSGMQNILKRVK